MASYKFHLICVTLVAVIICYERYDTSNILLVRKKHPKFSLNGPYNVTSIQTKDVYEKLIDVDDFHFVKNPQPCKDYPAGFLLLVIVTSNPVNYENRMVIRNTWGKNVDATRTVFMLGLSKNSTMNEKIDLESKKYGDIVQGTFTDAYRNMTYKHVMGLKWVAHHCPVAKYVLKTDDDMVVNSRELRRFLAKELSPWGARQLIGCQIMSQIKPSKSGKWAVTEEEYPLDSIYPTYCAGFVILYSLDVVMQILEEAQRTRYFWIDDVHLTGVIAQKLGVHRTSLNNLVLSRPRFRILKTLGPKYLLGNFLFGPPNLSLDTMRTMWKSIPA